MDVRVTESFTTNTTDYAINSEDVGVCQQNNYWREKEPFVPEGKRKVEVLTRRHRTRVSHNIGADHYEQVSAQEKVMKLLNFERILCPVAQSHESDEGLRYAVLIRAQPV